VRRLDRLGEVLAADVSAEHDAHGLEDERRLHDHEEAGQHGTFVLGRTYLAPARVFAAWADLGANARWIGAPGE
jgi:hypothetical protein